MDNKYYAFQSGCRVVGDPAALGEDEAIAIGKAYANWLIYKVGKNPVDMNVAVGVGPTNSGNAGVSDDPLAVGLMKGLHAFGCKQGYAGAADAQAMYLSTVLPYWEFDGAALVTENGIRFFTPYGEIQEEELKDLLYHASRAYLSSAVYDPEEINLMEMCDMIRRSDFASLEGAETPDGKPVIDIAKALA